MTTRLTGSDRRRFESFQALDTHEVNVIALTGQELFHGVSFGNVTVDEQNMHDPILPTIVRVAP